jgi:hypothetical protein
MLSTRVPLRFENNPTFLWKIFASSGNQIADCCPGIYPGSCEVPIYKPGNLYTLVLKINIPNHSCDAADSGELSDPDTTGEKSALETRYEGSNSLPFTGG